MWHMMELIQMSKRTKNLFISREGPPEWEGLEFQDGKWVDGWSLGGGKKRDQEGQRWKFRNSGGGARGAGHTGPSCVSAGTSQRHKFACWKCPDTPSSALHHRLALGQDIWQRVCTDDGFGHSSTKTKITLWVYLHFPFNSFLSDRHRGNWWSLISQAAAPSCRQWLSHAGPGGRSLTKVP